MDPLRRRAPLRLDHRRETGGEAGIRTLVGVAAPSRFQRAPFDRSGTSPKLVGRAGVEPASPG